MQTRIRQLVLKKGSQVVTIHAEATVDEAVRRMVFAKVGAVVVVNDAVPCGIFTEREVMTRVLSRERNPGETLVRDVMTPELLFVGPDDSVEDCLRLMTTRRRRHLLVAEHGQLLGLLSQGDCVAHLCSELTIENHALHDYIMGVYPG